MRPLPSPLAPLLFALIAAAAAWRLGHVPLDAPLVLGACAAVGAGLGALLAALVRLVRRRPVSWRALGVSLVAGAAGLSWLLLSPPGPAVMIVLIDCLRDDRLDAARMPRLNALAGTGWRFTHARASAPWTRSSVPAMLGSAWPVQHRMYRTLPEPDRLAPEITLISEVFQQAGWDTAAFAQQAQLDAAFGMGAGYDRYGTTDGRSESLNARFLAWHLLHRTRPRLVYLHYLDVHLPYRPKGRNRPRDLTPFAARLNRAAGWRDALVEVRDGVTKLSAADRADIDALYDGEARQLDARLGELFERLEADGSLDQTWLVITADHGELLGEHGELSHMRALWEELLRVPLVIRPPGGAVGARVEAVARHVDVAPTLVEAAGLQAPQRWVGRSLLPLTRGEALAPAPAYAEEWSGETRRLSVVLDGWKLVRAGEMQTLYHLATDPGETTDALAAQPEIAARLGALLDDYIALGPTTRDDAAGAGLSEEAIEGLREMGYMD